MSIADIEVLRHAIGFYDVKDQLKNHVYARSRAAFAAGDQARDGIRDTAALGLRQESMRAAFVESFGGLPPSDGPVPVETRSVHREPGLAIANLVYQPRPATFVTANLYIPDGIRGSTGAVLFLSGHLPEARLSDEYQVVCRHLAREGLVVLAPDPVGQGERLSYWEAELGAPTVRRGTGEHDYAGAPALLLGDGIARYFVHDAMRAIDLLSERPEVDPGRIGVTGNSGGGTQCCMVMVCDPRVAAAAPATFLMSRETYMDAGQAQDAEQIWKGMSALGFDHEDLLLTMVPRPVLVMAVTSDFFPIEGTRRTVERARRLWDVAGSPRSIELYEEKGEHAYTPTMAARAAAFFGRHLGAGTGKTAKPRLAVSTAPVAARRLWCTGSGQVRGEIPGARAAYEENCARLDLLERERAALPDAQRRSRAEAWLRDAVYRDRRPCTPNLRELRGFPGGMENGLSYRVLLWWSQERVMGAGVLFRDLARTAGKLRLTLGLWQHCTGELGRHMTWIRSTCEQGRVVLVADLSGMGMLQPNAINSEPMFESYGTICKLAHDLVWLGDSLPALRAWELTRALDVVLSSVEDVDPRGMEISAFGRYSLYAELAAFLDPRLRALTLVEPPESLGALVRARHYENADVSAVILPGMLRYFDLPDLRRWRTEEKSSSVNAR
jgi:hypothetical protein